MDELRFSALLLRTNHKSGETWACRRRFFAEALACAGDAAVGDDPSACGPSDGVRALVRAECELIEELARKYSHHYYAWNHWAWLERLCAGRSDFGTTRWAA